MLFHFYMFMNDTVVVDVLHYKHNKDFELPKFDSYAQSDAFIPEHGPSFDGDVQKK